MPLEEATDFAAEWAAAAKAAEAAEGNSNGEEQTEAPAKAEGQADVLKEEGSEGEAQAKPEEPESDTKGDELEDESDPEARAIHKRKRLEALAKELGYKLDGDHVSIEDRVKFREEQRARQKALRARAEELEAERAKLIEEDKTKGEKYHKLLKAIEDTDLDTIAAELGAKSWDELNRQFLIQRSSPHAKEMAALKKKLAEQEEQSRKAEQARAEQARAEQVEKERKQYFAELSDDVDDADDESIRSLGKVNGFKEIVLRYEQEHYDPARNVVTISRKDAMAKALADARKSYEDLKAVFEPKAAEPEAKGKRGKGKASAATDVGARTKTLADIDTTTPEGNAEFFRLAESMMKHADR